MNVNEKIEKIRGLMRNNGISFYIIPTSDTHGSEYIDACFKEREFMSGFTGSAGTLVISDKEAALFVDGRYHIQADNETKDCEIIVYKLGNKDVPTVSEYLKNNVMKNDTVGFNGNIMTAESADCILKDIDCNREIELDLVGKIWNTRPEQNINKVLLIDKNICGEDAASKIEKVRTFICKKNADGMLISALDDVCYLFNIRGTDVSYGSVAFSYAYITKDTAVLFLKNGAYDKCLVEHFEKQGVYIADYDDILLELHKLKGKKILIDREYTSSYFEKILSIGNEVLSIKNYEAIKKHIKNETEQELARKYAVIDAISVIEFIARLKIEINEAGAALDDENSEYDEAYAERLLDSIREKGEGFFALSFKTISAYAENAAIVHYSAPDTSSKQIKNRGLLLVDSGAHYMGATTDITRTIALGPLSDKEKRAFTLVLKGNLKLMDAVFIKGTRCENLDILARESLWKEGLDFRHGTGHGIGAFLNVHEGPYRIGYRIREDMPQPEIEPGMIISDEPGLYFPGEFGIRHETQLLCIKCTESEYGEFYCFEPLSLVPFDKEAIDFALLSCEELEILKRYSRLIRKKVADKLSENAKKWLYETTDYVD